MLMSAEVASGSSAPSSTRARTWPREQLRVPGAEVGPVGLAEVGELAVAERGAQHVQVAGRVRGCRCRAAASRRSLAHSRANSLLCGDDGGQLGGRGRRVARSSKYLSSCGPVMQCTAGWLPPTPRGSNPTTSNRVRTAADTALRACSRVLDARPAGAARVDDQGADPRARIRGGQLDHRQREPLPGRAAVVERHEQPWRTGSRCRTASSAASARSSRPAWPAARGRTCADRAAAVGCTAAGAGRAPGAGTQRRRRPAPRGEQRRPSPGVPARSGPGAAACRLAPAAWYVASYACRDPQTLAREHAHRRPSAASFITTASAGTLCPTTVPGPSGVSTVSPSFGACSWNSW